MAKPNFFIIGLPRAGTTSFYEYLKRHSEVFISPIKGPNFFGEEPNKNYSSYHKNKEKYLSLFKNANKKVIGEASHYFNSINAPKEIKKFNPNSKILILLRDPKDLLNSYFINEMTEEKRDLMACLKNSKDKIMRNLEMSNNLKRWLKEFPSKQIKIIIFEKFVQNPKEEFQKLEDFLGISHQKIELKKYNPASKSKRTWIFRFIGRLPLSVKKKIKKIGPREKIIDSILKLSQRKKIDNELMSKEKTKLKKYFEEEVKKTNDLLKEKNILERKDDLNLIWGYN